jgi:hypothetical protein
MNNGASSTAYTTCFALFILDLFGETRNWSQEEKKSWIAEINRYQVESNGYFIPEAYMGPLNSKPVHQLTCFCLSALEILGGSPKYPLSFLEQWKKPEDIFRYLEVIGVAEGKPRTGNMAMFLAIFLTYQFEKHQDTSALEKLEAWFEFHRRTQNPRTGLWGDTLEHRYYFGLLNAFHQFVIFNYWNRKVPHSQNIVDRVLTFQNHDGHFGPLPGGGGCFDFDSADVLINLGYLMKYRKDDVIRTLEKLKEAILKDQNEDGGFCESKHFSPSLKRLISPKQTAFLFNGFHFVRSFIKLRQAYNIVRSKKRMLNSHWTEEGRRWNQSNLWDTWFRCLTIAEIDTALNKGLTVRNDWNFHDFIGLGFFRKKD